MERQRDRLRDIHIDRQRDRQIDMKRDRQNRETVTEKAAER